MPLFTIEEKLSACFYALNEIMKFDWHWFTVNIYNYHMWDKVFKSGLSKFYGRQPLKNLLSPLLNTLSHISKIKSNWKKNSGNFESHRHFPNRQKPEISLAIQKKGETQNGCYKKTMHTKFSEK